MLDLFLITDYLRHRGTGVFREPNTNPLLPSRRGIISESTLSCFLPQQRSRNVMLRRLTAGLSRYKMCQSFTGILVAISSTLQTLSISPEALASLHESTPSPTLLEPHIGYGQRWCVATRLLQCLPSFPTLRAVKSLQFGYVNCVAGRGSKIGSRNDRSGKTILN
jgi:hypothetical protein